MDLRLLIAKLGTAEIRLVQSFADEIKLAATAPSSEMRLRLKALAMTLVLLRSYRRHGINSRTFMIRNHVDLLVDIRLGQNSYSDYSEEARLVMEQRIQMEFLERLCQLIEDFAIICSALLTSDLANFPGEVTKKPNPCTFFRQFDDAKITRILRYKDLGLYNLTDADKAVVESIRRSNLLTLASFRDACVAFLELHWQFYQKHKHGNTLLYGLLPISNDVVRTTYLPAISNLRDPSSTKVLLVTEATIETWKLLFDTLVLFLQDVVVRAARFIETGEVGLLENSNLNVNLEISELVLREVIERYDIDRSYYSPWTDITGVMNTATANLYAANYSVIRTFLSEFRVLNSTSGLPL